MFKASLPLLVLCILVPAAAGASSRAASLVRSFVAICTAGPLDFERLNAKASAMKLKVVNDTHAPADASGHFVRAKTWSVALKTGAYRLTASEAVGSRGHILGCGIGAPDVDGNDVKAELMKIAKPGAPRNEIVSPNNSRRVTMWDYGNEGEGMQLMLTDTTPMKKPGFNLALMQASAARK